MLDPHHQPRLTVLRRTEVGRVTIHAVAGSAVHEAAGDGRPPSGARHRDPPYLLAVPVRNGLRCSQHGRAERVAEGGYVLLSQRHSFAVEVERGGEALVASLPSADLAGRLASVEDHAGRRFEPNARMGRLLADLLRGVADAFADVPPPNPEALATEVLGFVALTLGAENRGAAADVRNGRYRLRRRIFDFVETNLGDPDLSPRTIAASSRISLSYLYSLFSDDNTTVGQFVQAKRLQRAYELLVADPCGRQTVSEIAYEVGFKNVSHFSRSFSRRFRVAPRDVRQVARAGEECPPRRLGAETGLPAPGAPRWRPDPTAAPAHG